MNDVSNKFNTLRYANAEGIIITTKEIIEKIKNKEVPKGDVLEVSRAAGINAAKKTSETIIFCHPVPIDWAGVSYELLDDKIIVNAEVKAIWKTGVEMEALIGVSILLNNIWDMTKYLEKDETGQYPNTQITNIRVIKKEKEIIN